MGTCASILSKAFNKKNVRLTREILLVLVTFCYKNRFCLGSCKGNLPQSEAGGGLCKCCIKRAACSSLGIALYLPDSFLESF